MTYRGVSFIRFWLLRLKNRPEADNPSRYNPIIIQLIRLVGCKNYQIWGVFPPK